MHHQQSGCFQSPYLFRKHNSETTTASIKGNWIDLDLIAFKSQHVISNIISLNSTTIIESRNTALWAYSMNTKKWSLFTQFPFSKLQHSCHLCLDPEQQILYLFSSTDGTLVIIDLKTKQCKWEKVPIRIQNGKIAMIDGRLNIFGGHQSINHYRYNKYSIQPILKLHQIHSLTSFSSYYDIVHLKQRKMIYLLCPQKEYIKYYDIKSKEWNQCNVKLPHCRHHHGRRFDCIATDDERYIIILSTMDINKLITIFDTMDMTIKDSKESNIFANNVISYGQVINARVAKLEGYDSNILINGYIRINWEIMFGDTTHYIIPIEVIEMIEVYYDKKYFVYMFGGTNNYKISVSHLLLNK